MNKKKKKVFQTSRPNTRGSETAHHVCVFAQTQELLPPNWSDFFSRHRGNGDLILWDRAATPSVKQTAYAKDP